MDEVKHSYIKLLIPNKIITMYYFNARNLKKKDFYERHVF